MKKGALRQAKPKPKPNPKQKQKENPRHQKKLKKEAKKHHPRVHLLENPSQILNPKQGETRCKII